MIHRIAPYMGLRPPDLYGGAGDTTDREFIQVPHQVFRGEPIDQLPRRHVEYGMNQPRQAAS